MFFKKKCDPIRRRSISDAKVGDFVRCYTGANQEFEIVCLVTSKSHWGGMKIQCVYADHPAWKAGESVVITTPWDRNWAIVEEK